MSRTDTHSIRCDNRLYAIAKILIRRHPNTISLSYIFQLGIETAIAKAISNGEIIPEDPIGVLREMVQEDLSNLQTIDKGLEDLQEEYRNRASRTLAGQTEPVHEDGLKPGYHYEIRPDERGNPVRVAVEDSYDR